MDEFIHTDDIHQLLADKLNVTREEAKLINVAIYLRMKTFQEEE